MKLLIQPGDDVDRLVKAIEKAKKSVEIVIFRFDRGEIERALMDAVQRGVFVHALIAFTNRGGEEHLRRLEMRFLEKGITVARTAGDLVRYHGKMMIVDRKELFILSFNFTHLDIDHSRAFGLITRNSKLVQEAVKLFEADTKRQDYIAGHPKFLVSPVNARKQLAAFIRGARRELMIYDPKISDRAMLRLLLDRQKAGVTIRTIGCVSGARLPARELVRLRLHTRTIIRDRQEAFLGSQSLRQLELEARREIGVIFRNRAVVSAMIREFEEDWKASEPAKSDKIKRAELPVSKTAKKVAKHVSRSLPVKRLVGQVIKTIARKANGRVQPAEIEAHVRVAVKKAVKEVVQEATADAVKTAVEEIAQPEK